MFLMMNLTAATMTYEANKKIKEFIFSASLLKTDNSIYHFMVFRVFILYCNLICCSTWNGEVPNKQTDVCSIKCSVYGCKRASLFK